MTVTAQSLADHFQLLSDDELRDQFQSHELTTLAQSVATAELRRRGLDLPQPIAEPDEDVQATSIGDPFVPVARFLDPTNALLLQSRLEAEGVTAMVADIFTAQNIPSMGTGGTGARVMVPQSYFERAHEIAAALERGPQGTKAARSPHWTALKRADVIAIGCLTAFIGFLVLVAAVSPQRPGRPFNFGFRRNMECRIVGYGDPICIRNPTAFPRG